MGLWVVGVDFEELGYFSVCGCGLLVWFRLVLIGWLVVVVCLGWCGFFWGSGSWICVRLVG